MTGLTHAQKETTVQYSFVHPMEPAPTPAPTVLPQSTVTVPAVPPPATVTVPAPQVPQIQQWNPVQPPAQGQQPQQFQVHPMQAPAAQDAGSGVGILPFLASIPTVLVFVFVIVGIWVIIKVNAGGKSADQKTGWKQYALLVGGVFMIALLLTGALWHMSSGFATSIPRYGH